MKFALCAAVFAALTLAAPAPLGKRAVFTTKTYNELSISGGVAGNAQQEALDVLSGLPDDLTTVEKADLDFLNSVNQIANKAETGVFNPAIEAAASQDEADALQRGKIKNKVLKLTATVLKLQAQEAQGQNVASKLATEQKKLNNNIALDEDAAGLPSTALSFDATTT
ncbi:hypothetical protein BR93DRAFT_962319 [Coniochaeta sp. PMI_546]|nr:hypothetical protein BR93DRAFT_962319 [Coniochaeta sp. PMI_546]